MSSARSVPLPPFGRSPSRSSAWSTVAPLFPDLDLSRRTAANQRLASGVGFQGGSWMSAISVLIWTRVDKALHERRQDLRQRLESIRHYEHERIFFPPWQRGRNVALTREAPWRFRTAAGWRAVALFLPRKVGARIGIGGRSSPRAPARATPRSRARAQKGPFRVRVWRRASLPTGCRDRHRRCIWARRRQPAAARSIRSPMTGDRSTLIDLTVRENRVDDPLLDRLIEGVD